VTTPFELDSNVLSERQLARVACLRAAREVLVSKALMSSGAADPIDLVNLARFIETGQDPYDVPRYQDALTRAEDDAEVTR
jgi:hypothetical protein